jgi:hypothetical protein
MLEPTPLDPLLSRIGPPGADPGLRVPLFPYLAPVPGCPVYVASGMAANYFYFDGLFWIYRGGGWFAGIWYDGPWGLVPAEVVPMPLLWVPVRSFRDPPAGFRAWQGMEPPHWGEVWGAAWEARRSGWEQWDRHSAPALARLPGYQKGFAGPRYPRPEEQWDLHNRNFRYHPGEPLVKVVYQLQETGLGAERTGS